jgi:hypothetical protein
MAIDCCERQKAQRQRRAVKTLSLSVQPHKRSITVIATLKGALIRDGNNRLRFNMEESLKAQLGL